MGIRDGRHERACGEPHIISRLALLSRGLTATEHQIIHYSEMQIGYGVS